MFKHVVKLCPSGVVFFCQNQTKFTIFWKTNDVLVNTLVFGSHEIIYKYTHTNNSFLKRDNSFIFQPSQKKTVHYRHRNRNRLIKPLVQCVKTTQRKYIKYTREIIISSHIDSSFTRQLLQQLIANNIILVPGGCSCRLGKLDVLFT